MDNFQQEKTYFTPEKIRETDFAPSEKYSTYATDHQTLQISTEISFTIWIQLISFGGMSSVFLCIFVCL